MHEVLNAPDNLFYLQRLLYFSFVHMICRQKKGHNSRSSEALRLHIMTINIMTLFHENSTRKKILSVFINISLCITISDILTHSSQLLAVLHNI